MIKSMRCGNMPLTCSGSLFRPSKPYCLPGYVIAIVELSEAFRDGDCDPFAQTVISTSFRRRFDLSQLSQSSQNAVVPASPSLRRKKITKESKRELPILRSQSSDLS